MNYPPPEIQKNYRKIVGNKKVICNFAASFPFWVSFNGLCEIREGGVEGEKTEVSFPDLG